MAHLTEADRRWIERASANKKNSHDLETQVGAVIASGDKLISDGANRLPLGVQSNVERTTAPGKYDWIVHAEQIAIANVHRPHNKHQDKDLYYATLYCTAPMCGDCMKAVIMSGIRRVVMPSRMEWDGRNKNWRSSMYRAEKMAEEAGIELIHYGI